MGVQQLLLAVLISWSVSTTKEALRAKQWILGLSRHSFVFSTKTNWGAQEHGAHGKTHLILWFPSTPTILFQNVFWFHLSCSTCWVNAEADCGARGNHFVSFIFFSFSPPSIGKNSWKQQPGTFLIMKPFLSPLSGGKGSLLLGGKLLDNHVGHS